ncbi:MAG: hypothetical protein ABIZ91_15380 [Gemmatimonadaceae bacterium]
MASAGLFASWVAVAFGAWAFAIAMGVGERSAAIRRSARRALMASGLAAGAASAIMVALLVKGDLSVSFVARSIATNLPTAFRVAALWSQPAGAVLPAAALVALAGVLATGRDRASFGLAAAAATVVALLAASVAASPFAILPWLPVEGLGLAPSLQHGAAVFGRIALTFAVAACAASAAVAADTLALEDAPASRTRALARWLLVSAALLLMAATFAAHGAFAAGDGATPVPLTAWHSSMLPALVALVGAYRARTGSPVAALLGALGLLGLACGLLVGAGALARNSLALAAFVIASLGASLGGAGDSIVRHSHGVRRVLGVAGIGLLAAGALLALRTALPPAAWIPGLSQWLLVAGAIATAFSLVEGDARAVEPRAVLVPVLGALAGAGFGFWLGRGAVPMSAAWGAVAGTCCGTAVLLARRAHDWRDRGVAVLLAAAAACAALAAAGESAARVTQSPLASGATLAIPIRFGGTVRLAHQGISRYEGANSHVVALALEASGGPFHDRLLTPQRREFVDGRDETLGPAVDLSSTASTAFEELRVHLEEVEREERVSVRVTSVPLSMGWRLAVLLVVGAAVLASIPAARGADLHTNEGLGE